MLAELKEMAARADECESMETVLGIEGTAPRLYFEAFEGLLKAEPGEDSPRLLRFDFAGRNRRPPRDAVNALLSLGYSLLVKDLTIACYAADSNPIVGFCISRGLDGQRWPWTGWSHSVLSLWIGR